MFSLAFRTRREGIEYEYEYHFIEYEYEQRQNAQLQRTKAGVGGRGAYFLIIAYKWAGCHQCKKAPLFGEAFFVDFHTSHSGRWIRN